MPDSIGQNPYVKKLLSAVAVTASASSATLTMPNDLEDFLIILDVTYTSGTTATLDTVLEVSPDNGTTFYMHSRYAQVTTSSAKRILSISRRRHAGQAASEYADANTGGAAANNGPIPQNFRFRFTTSGTNPTYAVTAWLIGNRQVVY